MHSQDGLQPPVMLTISFRKNIFSLRDAYKIKSAPDADLYSWIVNCLDVSTLPSDDNTSTRHSPIQESIILLDEIRIHAVYIST